MGRKFSQLYEAPSVSTSRYSYESTYTPPVKELDWNTLVVEPVKGMLAEATSYIPDVLAAIYILVFGWILAKGLQFLVGKFLTAVKFDSIAEKTGISGVLNENDIGLKPSVWFSRLSFWFVMILSVIKALGALRLRFASSQLNHVIDFGVIVLTALVILVLGLFLSSLMEKIVTTTAKSLKLSSPEFHGRIVQWAVIILTSFMVLNQFLVPPQFILIAFGVAFVTLCITFVIAFGWGGQGFAAKVLDKLVK